MVSTMSGSGIAGFRHWLEALVGCVPLWHDAVQLVGPGTVMVVVFLLAEDILFTDVAFLHDVAMIR